MRQEYYSIYANRANLNIYGAYNKDYVKKICVVLTIPALLVCNVPL